MESTTLNDLSLADARHLQQTGQYAEAEKACRQLLVETPEDPAVRVLLALVLTQMQKSEAIVEAGVDLQMTTLDPVIFDFGVAAWTSTA